MPILARVQGGGISFALQVNSVPLDFQLGDMELHCKLRGIGKCKELLLNAGGVPSHSLKQV